MKTIRHYWLLLCILLVGLFLGLYNLDGIPAEMWSDATAHYTLAEQVRSGNLFFDYQFGGDGPIYTYLVVATAAILGLSFYTLKLTAVLISLAFIASMYFLAYELFKNKRLAYIASFLTAVSFWSLTFARQPHARILVPLFIALTLLLVLKKKNIWGGILLGLGMYTQASFWAMPFAFFNKWKTLLIGLLIIIPLIYAFQNAPIGFLTDQSYFGEKLATTADLSLWETIIIILSNISANLLSFHVRGDETFRLNVPFTPHLDFISGFFFVIGLILLLTKIIKEKNMRLLQFIILPFFLIQLPSILDIHNPDAQPNIGRMIGVIPFVFLWTAYGIEYGLLKFVSTSIHHFKYKKAFISCILIIVLGLILASNVYKYFIQYPKYLPNENTPYAKIIASKIDSLSTDTAIVMVGRSWGEWQQPEQDAVLNLLTIPRETHFLADSTPIATICTLANTSSKKSIVLVANPQKTTLKKDMQTCATVQEELIVKEGKYTIAQFLRVVKR